MYSKDSTHGSRYKNHGSSTIMVLRIELWVSTTFLAQSKKIAETLKTILCQRVQLAKLPPWGSYLLIRMTFQTKCRFFFGMKCIIFEKVLTDLIDSKALPSSILTFLKLSFSKDMNIIILPNYTLIHNYSKLCNIS